MNNLIDNVRNLIKTRFVQNVFALYCVHFINYLIPIITIPYLTRILGAVVWGNYAFVQAVALYSLSVIEYSFTMSATREVARHRDDTSRLGNLIASVFGAKLILSLIVIIILLIITPFVENLRSHITLLWIGVTWSILQSFNLMWYFQGLERMKLVAILDVSMKALSLVCIFVFVHTPTDVERIFIFQAAGSLLSVGTAYFIASQEIPLLLPDFTSIRRVMKDGWSLFVSKLAVNVYTIGNVLIVGLISTPYVIGQFAGADKISKAVLGMMAPLSQAMYPRLTYLTHKDRNEGYRWAKIGIIVSGCGNIVVGAVIFLTAPYLVQWLLGSEFTGAVTILRVLAILPPLSAINGMLGGQWMLSLGMDKAYNRTLIFAATVNIIAAIILVPRLEGIGMALSVILTELVIFVLFILYLRRNKSV